MVSQVQRQPLAAQAAQLLLTRIKDGEWALGQRLPGETTLAAQLGVGRSTLREAIRELAGKGVLDSRPGRRSVRHRTGRRRGLGHRAAQREHRLGDRSPHRHRGRGRRAGRDPSHPYEILRTIRRTLAARGVTGQSVPEHVDADMAFHRAVIAAAHNDVLIQLLDAFLPRLRLAMIDMLKIHPISSEPCDHDLHQQLADAIVARDPAAAAAASRTHLSTLKESFS
ncbi:FadR/GntR family transcriptional regulator [Mycolicibacterium aubagnense]